MADISASISLFDRMTGPVMGMVNSIDMLVGGLGEVQSAGEKLGGDMPFDDMRVQIDLAAAAAERQNGLFDMMEGYIRRDAEAQQEATAKAQEFNDELRQSPGYADALLGKLGQIGAAIGLAFGARQVKYFFEESIDMANREIQTEQQLVNVLANQGATRKDFIAIKEQAASIQDSSMYSSTAMLGGAAELATYIKDADALQSMMVTLTDYAAGMSGGAEVGYKQMVDYATQIGKVFDGTYDGITQKGFSLSDAQKAIIESNSLEELTKQGVALSDEYQQLVQDNYELAKAMVVSDVISQSWGGLSEQMANTPAGMMARMKNAFDTLRTDIGVQLLPAVMGVMDTVKSHMPQIQQLLTGLVPAVQFVIGAVGGIIDAAADVFDYFEGNWPLIEPLVAAVGGAFDTVVSAIRDNVIPAILPLFELVVNTVIPQITEAVSTVGPAIEFASGLIGDIAAVAMTVFQCFADNWPLIEPLVASIANAAMEIVGTVRDQLIPAVVPFVTMVIGTFLPQISAGISALGPVINFIVGLIQNIVGAATSVFQFFTSNWPSIEPIVWGIVGAFVAYNAAMAVMEIVTLAQAAAQAIMNSTLLANPITWVVIAIAAIIAAIVLWVNSIGGLRVAWLTVVNAVLSAWDAVKIGFFTGVYWVLDLWDKMAYGISAAGTAVANFMGDMRVSVLTILQNMVNSAIDIINKFIGVLRSLPGVEIGFVQQVTFGTKAALQNEADRQVREAALNDQRVKMEANAGERAGKIDSMEAEALSARLLRESGIEAAKREAEQKKNGQEVEPLPEPPQQPEPLPAPEPKLEPENFLNTSGLGSGGLSGGGAGGGSAGDIAGNTGRTAANTAKQIDISEENLKYLRDIAERETINRFTTAEVSIEMGGVNNNVSSEMDLDGIISYLAEGTREALLEVAEGVHF